MSNADNMSSASKQEISPTTELVEVEGSPLHLEDSESEPTKTFRETKFSPNDFLYEDMPWMLEKTPIYKYVQKKSPHFEFKRKYGGRRANNNAFSRQMCTKNEEKFNTLGDSAAAPCASTCPSIPHDGPKNADLKENQTQSSVKAPTTSKRKAKKKMGKIIAPALSDKNNDERELVHINTAEKVAFIEKVLKAQLTIEDQKLMPKDIPEYESIFDGSWVLGKMPPYLDSSIPKGPTPPSPIQFQFQKKPSGYSKKLTDDKNEFENWHIGSFPQVPREIVSETEDADPWVLPN